MCVVVYNVARLKQSNRSLQMTEGQQSCPLKSSAGMRVTFLWLFFGFGTVTVTRSGELKPVYDPREPFASLTEENNPALW